MKVVVALEHRFTQVGDQVYSGMFGYDRFWYRYLEVFDEVCVLARVEQQDAVAPHFARSSGPGVTWLKVPYFLGPMQYLRRRGAVRRLVRDVARYDAAFMLRVPGTLGIMLGSDLRRLGRPFGVEVVGDPWDVFAPGGNTSRLRPIFRIWHRTAQARLCQQAVVASYVTREALQRRYPPGGWNTHYSSVYLDDADFLDETALAEREARYTRPRSADQPWICAHLGTMSQSYKRQDLLIDAVAQLRRRGIPIALRLAGSGQLESAFRQRAEEQGVADAVRFCGRVEPGAGVRAFLKEADLFVLPSRQEGLPRVLIEAMACGLPALASEVGGMAELLDADELFPADAVATMTAKMAALLNEPARMAGMVRRNAARAQRYHESVLQQRRRLCYGKLKEATEAESPAGRACLERAGSD